MAGLWATVAPAQAQEPGPRVATVFTAARSSPNAELLLPSGSGVFSPQVRSEPSDGLLSFAKSAVLPGWGQWSSGQSRAWVYLAAEGLTWWAYLHHRGLGDRRRSDYRDLAWERGRIQQGVRQDGDFDYYERMGNFARSGAFDLDGSAAGLQPEQDPATYNGRIWGLAVGLFLGPGPVGPGSPGYEAALDYYRDRAYSDAFLWDWSPDLEGQQEFRGLIEASDDAFQTARIAVGTVIANHLVSALDAFLSNRGPLGSVSSAFYPSSEARGAIAWEWRVRLR